MASMEERHTPIPLIEAARQVMGGIDLDPASSTAANATVRANRYFTRQDNGLLQPWHGRVWLNPPRNAKDMKAFIGKLLSEDGVVQAITLTELISDTEYGQSLVGNADIISLLRGRVKHQRPDGKLDAPVRGSMVCGFGVNMAAFCQAFGGRVGICLINWKKHGGRAK